MALKTYSIKLEEREYESYMADLDRALPDSDKSEFSVKNQIAYWGIMLTLLILRLHLPLPWLQQ